MELAAQYARALYEAKDKSLPNLRAALKRRGHEKLLPRIYAEYKKLLTGAERRAAAAKVTPEAERTRILLELYHKLTQADTQ